MDLPEPLRKSRWLGLSLRQTLFMGAGLGIFVPAVILAAYQINSKLETQVDIRVRAPMQQQADVLSRSLGMAIWNVDQGAAAECEARGRASLGVAEMERWGYRCEAWPDGAPRWVDAVLASEESTEPARRTK